MTLIGGLTTATLLTLLVVPVLYTLFDDLREALSSALRGVISRLSRSRPRPAPAVSEQA
jgi:HAE1 family hydrophobic/amphiphilic exporter-1